MNRKSDTGLWPPWVVCRPSAQMTKDGEGIRCLLLIRLFQQAAISSVRACHARPFQRMCASFNVSLLPKRRASTTWPPVAGLMLPVPAMRTRARLHHGETATLEVRGVPPSSVSHGGDDPAQHQDSVDAVVLGRIPDDDRQAWSVGALAPATIGPAPI